ncbi:ABC transporter ATP-binding protein [Clostridium hydrogeniformans]|uniref:ABC transporter ATP-binding protein n=1 Tax=Clostridium hydrogeniformans TaxID=349933 RepID=UPI000488B27D|nr:ABC transporter ATP-binding protein [Clostridium hydrogeniformans]
MIKTFAKYYKPYKKLFTLDLIAAFLVSACDLIYPMMTRVIVDDVQGRNLRTLYVFGGTLIVIYIIKAGLNYFLQYWGHVVGVRMQADMRRDLFKHLQVLPNKYFDNNKTGVIMSRIINDLMEVSELAHHGPEDLFISLVMLIGSFIILCTINVPLTIIVFAFIPVLLWFTSIKRLKMKKAFMETRVKTGEVNAALENSISGVRVTKAFTNTEHELEKFHKHNNLFKEAREYAYKAMAEFSSGMGFFMDILDLVVLVAAGYFVYKGKITLGDFTAYLLYIRMFLQPVKRLISFTEQYQSGMTGFQRFMEIMNEKPENEKDNAVELKDIKGEININNVSFGYDNKEHILNGLDLHVKEGKMVALVGPSGGGKTTLCNLLPRFYEIENGDILIDGQSIYDVTLESLRKNIGIVQQDVFLFTGTIRDNILYGNPDATDEEIEEAAKSASIHDFILGLEDGYDTYIGERGVKLSGGQKQRISIARVFLKNPPILILDEATSALDNATEYLIQKSLEKLCTGRTTLVVAHRLSTIKNADEIIVLTDNGVEERGSHKKLLNTGGIYSELYNSQFKDKEAS